MDFSERGKYYLALAVLGLLIFLHYFKIITPIENSIIKGFNFVQGHLFATGQTITDVFSRQKDVDFLIQEVEDLKKQNQDLTLKNQKLEFLQAENAELKQILNYKQPEYYKKVVARIIGQSGEDAKIIRINLGQNAGIKTGNAVLTPTGQMIGRVIESEDNVSSFLRITATESKYSIFVQKGDELVNGLLEGELGLSTIVNYLPVDYEYQVGDHLITSGWDEGIPFGIYVGEINRITSKKNDLFTSGTLKPINFNKLSLVDVLVEFETN